ncbi:MAG: hypothetical protein K0U74_13070 [Alphaproteobacteria bacterium]|nr:hypothetical protein [Alphaproteobacteria bacterium]
MVVALISLVYCLPPVIPSALAQSHAPALEAPQSAQGKKNTAKSIARTPLDDLPIPVQEMRDAILNAALRGDIEELRGPIEWNELRPEFAIPRDADPIAHWRKQSSDGHGRDILAILANLLASAPARLPLGADLENNDVFVWPYLSEISPGKLTPAQHVELLRIAPSAEVASMIARDKWTWYRLVIAADGTWHIFSKGSQSNLSEK